MASSLNQKFSKLNMNDSEDHKSVLRCIRSQVRSKKPVFEAYKRLCTTLGNDVIKYKDFEFWYYRFANGFDYLDYDRSKDPKTRDFSDIPVDIVKIIVGNLKWEDKLATRKVCRALREIVDSSEHRFDKVRFRIFRNSGMITAVLEIDDKFFEYKPMTDDITLRNMKTIHKKFWRAALDDMEKALNMPKVDINELSIDFGAETYSKSDDVIEATRAILSNLNYQIPIKMLSMKVEYQKEILAVLPYLKPEEMRIDIRGNFSNRIDNVVKLNQWKQLKSFKSHSMIFCPIESVFHLEKFDVTFYRVSVQDMVRLKNALMASPTFKEGVVNFFSPSDSDELQSIIGHGEIPIPGSNDTFLTEIDDEFVSFEKKIEE